MIAVRSLQKKIGQQEILRGVDLEVQQRRDAGDHWTQRWRQECFAEAPGRVDGARLGEIWIQGQNIIGMNERQLGAIRQKDRHSYFKAARFLIR